MAGANGRSSKVGPMRPKAQMQATPTTAAGGATGIYRSYSDEAAQLTSSALLAASAAESSLSRSAIRGAIASLRDAVAMHQRAGVAGGPALVKPHHEAYTRLNDRVRQLQRLMPRVP